MKGMRALGAVSLRALTKLIRQTASSRSRFEVSLRAGPSAGTLRVPGIAGRVGLLAFSATFALVAVIPASMVAVTAIEIGCVFCLSQVRSAPIGTPEDPEVAEGGLG